MRSASASEGRELRGNAYVGRKAEWPSWTPTANMIRRDPEEEPANMPAACPAASTILSVPARCISTAAAAIPISASTGTNQPNSIGYAMSSGCIRMLNHDVIDLYSRVGVGTKVFVIQA